MKASEVLKRYAKGERNFQGVNLCGQSFKEEDLSEADFSEADLRGTNFTSANLIKANFTGAKCGLQKRWLIIWFYGTLWIANTSLGCSFPIGILVSFTFYSSKIEYQILGQAGFVTLIFFLIIIILFGMKIGALTVTLMSSIIANTAIELFQKSSEPLTYIDEIIDSFIPLLMATIASIASSAVIAATVITAAIAVAGAITTSSMKFAMSATTILGIFIIILWALISKDEGFIAAAGIGAPVLSMAIGAFVGWRAMTGDPRDAWIKNFAVAFGSMRGTNFRKADLTEANFSYAKLKSTDMREATLTRVLWYGANMIDCVRPGDSYLQNTQVRKWLIGKGTGNNFDRQNLQGVNFQYSDLTNVSFIDTDLSQADLQGATLFEAKLVQTNLDKTNLRNADLTGAYIEDWGITRNTIFEGIKGDYVYQKLPTKYDRDPNRMPPSQQGHFGENDLYIFITSVLDTLDLYHRQNINAGVAITVLKGLTEDYPAKFELVGIEKRGDNQYVMKLQVFGQASHFQLQREYYARYEQTLPLYDPKMLMPDSENMVAEIIKTVKENPGTHIENLHNQNIVITEGKVDMSRNIKINKGNYYEQSGNLGIGHMSGGEIKEGAKVAGVINEAQKQNLADAAQEIQQLLEQLSENYPTTTSREQMTVVGEVVDRIEGNPPLKAKVINALKAGGTEAFKEAIDHPLVNILVATIEGWQGAE